MITEFVFKVNNELKIIMVVEEPLNEIDCCAEAPIYLIQDDKRIILSKDSVRENMQVLSNVLRLALNSALLLHESIKEDIGYLLNEEFQDKPGLTYKKLENRDHWVGFIHLLWSCDTATWIYNDKDGRIIIEFTPVYGGHFKDDYPINYDQWLKNYKPYLITKISKETAKEWLIQAETILDLIENNIKKLIE
jgi:hypothetical protein